MRLKCSNFVFPEILGNITLIVSITLQAMYPLAGTLPGLPGIVLGVVNSRLAAFSYLARFPAHVCGSPALDPLLM